MCAYVVLFCECEGTHQPDCALGKLLAIKYDPEMQALWDYRHPEYTEALIDYEMFRQHGICL